MTNYVQLGSINSHAGREAFLKLRSDYEVVNDPMERLEAARAIIANPAFSSPVPGGGMIDLDAHFPTAYDYAKAILPAIEQAGAAWLSDPGVVMWLYLAHASQLISKEARVATSYVLDSADMDDGHKRRNNRNTVFVHLTFFKHYRDDELLCRTILGTPPNVMNNAIERFAQSPKNMLTPAWVGGAFAMFFDPETMKYHKKPRKRKDCPAPKSAFWALREFTVVLGQYGKNYHFPGMSAEEIVNLLPDTKGLAPFKKHAAAWFARMKAQKDEMDAGHGDLVKAKA